MGSVKGILTYAVIINNTSSKTAFNGINQIFITYILRVSKHIFHKLLKNNSYLFHFRFVYTYYRNNLE